MSSEFAEEIALPWICFVQNIESMTHVSNLQIKKPLKIPVRMILTFIMGFHKQKSRSNNIDTTSILIY